MTNWKHVAKILKANEPKTWYRADDRLDFKAAIELCERMAYADASILAALDAAYEAGRKAEGK